MNSPQIGISMEKALQSLGVTGDLLTSEEKRKLDEEGYILLTDMLDAETLEAMRERYEYLMHKEGSLAGIEVMQEKGARILADLVNKGELFDKVWLHPKLLACVHHILDRPFKLSSLNGRDALPGGGNQKLHADWGSRRADEPYHVANSIWMLDDFTPDNGATRVVPRTHLLEGAPSDYIDNPEDAHPNQVLAVAPAGTVVVINSHLWHGGTLNRTQGTRRALHSYYVAREHPQQTDFNETIRLKTYRRLPTAAQYLLGIE